MNYKGENNKIKSSFNKRLKLKVFSMAVMTLALTMCPIGAKASIEDSSFKKVDVFEKVINGVIAQFKATSRNDESSIFQSLVLNPLNIVKSEVSFFDSKNFKEEFMDDKLEEESKVVEQISINPFKLSEGQISQQEVKQQATVDTVGNPADNSKKKILIYHSHTTEAYDGNTARVMDLSKTVAAVGDELAKQFEKQGFTVIHDKTIHDLDYNSAYAKSRQTVSKYLDKFGKFDFVVDLHRDDGPSKQNVTTTINGESCARLMVVTTTSDPRYKAHMSNINTLFQIAGKEYPKLFRERNLHTNISGRRYYNQDLSDNAILIEVGATSNKLEECKNSMKYLARVVAEMINRKK